LSGKSDVSSTLISATINENMLSGTWYKRRSTGQRYVELGCERWEKHCSHSDILTVEKYPNDVGNWMSLLFLFYFIANAYQLLLRNLNVDPCRGHRLDCFPYFQRSSQIKYDEEYLQKIMKIVCYSTYAECCGSELIFFGFGFGSTNNFFGFGFLD
jgi:hypothetical protein